MCPQLVTESTVIAIPSAPVELQEQVVLRIPVPEALQEHLPGELITAEVAKEERVSVVRAENFLGRALAALLVLNGNKVCRDLGCC